MEGAPADLNVVLNYDGILNLHQTTSKICQRLGEGQVHVRIRERGQELVFRFAGVALVRGGNEGVKNTFEGLGRARPALGKGFAVNRQLAEEVAGGSLVEIEVAASRGAGNRRRRIVRLRKESKARLYEPVPNQHSEVMPGAGALDFLMRGQRRMPAEYLEAVEPAVLDQQKPAIVAVRDQATNRAREASCSEEIHSLHSGAVG